jgi:hypothetical protein
MPQASEELRQQMQDRFGDSVDDAGPIRYLEASGYKLNRDWTWTPKPGVIDLKGMTREEFDCLLFLVHEWDFGGLST